jgi:ribosomal protein L11 methyltransferase
MHALLLECPAEEKDLLLAELWDRGAAGFVEYERPPDRFLLEAFFAQPFPAEAYAPWKARWEPVEDVNWARITMESFEPVLVGGRFFIVPDWRGDPTPPGRLRLEIHPGVALGTGYHPTTQMCLEAMERHFERGQAFLDLGAGSGILSQAAALLGGGRIVACDIDPQAVGAAMENLERAGVPALLFLGSVAAVGCAAVDFVAANISPGATIALAADIARVLRPSGLAVLSGFEPNRTGEVRAALGSAGFKILETSARDGWAALTVRGRQS